MILTEAQMTQGFEAVGIFLHEDEWMEFTENQKHSVRSQFKYWIMPFLLKLPDYATTELIEKEFYEDEFYAAAESFVVSKMRKNSIYENSTDEDLLRRLDEDEVEEAYKNLSALTIVFLKASKEAEVVDEDALIPLEDIAIDWDSLDIDKELQKFFQENES